MADFGPFGNIGEEDIAAINAIAAFLAQDECGDPPADSDAVVLAGNAMLWTLEAAVRLVKRLGIPLLLTGGRGHSTRFLQEAIAQHPRYSAMPQTAQSEAGLLRDLAVAFLDLPAERMIVEAESTNCSENAVFSKRALDAAGRHPAKLILIQDPLMQRRTQACFRQTWNGDASVQIVSWPVWVPQIAAADDGITFLNQPGITLWSPQRFLELLLGEVPRLRDDADGYGPHGKGFIPHIDIPEPVEAAFWHLTRCGRFSGAASRLSVPG